MQKVAATLHTADQVWPVVESTDQFVRLWIQRCQRHVSGVVDMHGLENRRRWLGSGCARPSRRGLWFSTLTRTTCLFSTWCHWYPWNMLDLVCIIESPLMGHWTPLYRQGWDRNDMDAGSDYRPGAAVCCRDDAGRRMWDTCFGGEQLVGSPGLAEYRQVTWLSLSRSVPVQPSNRHAISLFLTEIILIYVGDGMF